MTTPRQAAANRRHALHATGPRSVEGKRRSALNATRHGLCTPISASPWAPQWRALAELHKADGLDDAQAHRLAECILDYERNLQHQRNRYLYSLGMPGSGIDPAAAGRAQRETGESILANMPARGSPIPDVSRKNAQSAARFLLRFGIRQQKRAEQQLRNADRHLRRAANQLVKQCRASAVRASVMSAR